MTFQNYASIPDKKYIFYRRVINALFSEHDSKTKLGYVREKLCGLDQENFELILKSFSFLSYFENEFSFNRDYVNLKLKLIKSKRDVKFDNNKFISDLKSAISLWLDDEGLYSFAHRSLQEYFTALFITELKEDEKARVYNKIISKYNSSLSTPLREVDNLLQLLKEMDEYNYIKYFYYPLLLELEEGIKSQNLENYPKNYLKFFIQGVLERSYHDENNEENTNYKPFLTTIMDKTIYIHLPYTRKLYSFINQALKSDEFYNYFKNHFKKSNNTFNENYQIRTSSRHLIFNEEQFNYFYNLLDFNELNKLSNEIHTFINKEVLFCKDFIKKIDNTEKDLVDLI